jgi:hypothetical protein
MTSAMHIFDDLAFVGSYLLLLQRNASRDTRKVLVTLNSVYLCGLFIAVASMVMASIAISHDAFIVNTLLHVRYSVSGLSQL